MEHHQLTQDVNNYERLSRRKINEATNESFACRDIQHVMVHLEYQYPFFSKQKIKNQILLLHVFYLTFQLANSARPLTRTIPCLFVGFNADI